jgi:hypothetical protein
MIKNEESEGDSLTLILILPLHTTLMIIEYVKHTFSLKKPFGKYHHHFKIYLNCKKKQTLL